MDFKPQSFFIGLSEFIIVLLPGAALTAILLALEHKHPLFPGCALWMHASFKETATLFWIAFAFSSFGLGYFVSSIAAGLDPLYDQVRKQIYPYQSGLEESKYWKRSTTADADLQNIQSFEQYKERYLNNPFRKLLLFFFEFEWQLKVERSYDETNKLCKLQNQSVANASNPYRWACTVLEASYPEVYEQATRIMAASKFFRSLVIVSLIYAILQTIFHIGPSVWISLIFLLLSFREYIVQRQKSTQLTYRNLVTLYYLPDAFKTKK